MKEIKNLIKKGKWINSKTYEKTAPHEYLLKTTLNEEDKKTFDKFVRTINEKGYTKDFYKKQFTYLDIDGYKYWTMGAGNKTILINREKK
jgi:hypothetical protein